MKKIIIELCVCVCWKILQVRPTIDQYAFCVPERLLLLQLFLDELWNVTHLGASCSDKAIKIKNTIYSSQSQHFHTNHITWLFWGIGAYKERLGVCLAKGASNHFFMKILQMCFNYKNCKKIFADIKRKKK